MQYTEIEDLYDKFGGKFPFTVLLQKRVAQLVAGERRLVQSPKDDPISIAVAEARAGKIWLEQGELKTADETAGAAPAKN